MKKAIDLHGREINKLVDVDFAVIPLGSFEYHGPHSPFGTDIILAEGFSQKIDPDLNGVIYPVIPYTACPGKTTNYPGTISIRPSIIQEYLFDVIEGILKQGIKNIILLNAHDGNMGISRSVAEYETTKYMDASILLINWWQMVEVEKGRELGLKGTNGRGHGGPYEMSATKAFRPDLVQVLKEDLEFNEDQPLSNLPYVLIEGNPNSWDGYTGKIQQTSLEIGQKIIEVATRNMNKLIKKWLEQRKSQKG